MVLDVDEERRRISLGMKQVAANPWKPSLPKGDKVSGQIKSITDFGIFIGLDGGIDGLVHPTSAGTPPAKTSFATSRRAIPWTPSSWLSIRARAHLPGREAAGAGSVRPVHGCQSEGLQGRRRGEVDAKGAIIELADGIEGYVSARDIANERVDDATQHLKVGDKVEAKFVGMDRKGRTLQLSIKAKDDAEMREVLEEYQSSSASSGTTQLGALLRAQLNGNKSE